MEKNLKLCSHKNNILWSTFVCGYIPYMWQYGINEKGGIHVAFSQHARVIAGIQK